MLETYVDAPPILTDDDLTQMALAADPNTPLDGDAVPMWELFEPAGASLLPGWYLPQPMVAPRVRGGWHRWVGILLVASLLLIPAVGLCVTYGRITLA